MLELDPIPESPMADELELELLVKPPLDRLDEDEDEVLLVAARKALLVAPLEEEPAVLAVPPDMLPEEESEEEEDEDDEEDEEEEEDEEDDELDLLPLPAVELTALEACNMDPPPLLPLLPPPRPRPLRLPRIGGEMMET